MYNLPSLMYNDDQQGKFQNNIKWKAIIKIKYVLQNTNACSIMLLGQNVCTQKKGEVVVGKGKDDALERTNEDYQVDSPDLDELIIEMVHNISDTWIKEQIYRCIKNMIKED